MIHPTVKYILDTDSVTFSWRASKKLRPLCSPYNVTSQVVVAVAWDGLKKAKTRIWINVRQVRVKRALVWLCVWSVSRSRAVTVWRLEEKGAQFGYLRALNPPPNIGGAWLWGFHQFLFGRWRDHTLGDSSSIGTHTWSWLRAPYWKRKVCVHSILRVLKLSTSASRDCNLIHIDTTSEGPLCCCKWPRPVIVT